MQRDAGYAPKNGCYCVGASVCGCVAWSMVCGTGPKLLVAQRKRSNHARVCRCASCRREPWNCMQRDRRIVCERLSDSRTYRQAVEAICKRFPNLDTIPPLALVVKPVDPVDGCALVVATEQEHVVWVFHFVCKQEADGLQGLLAPIYVVACNVRR